MNHDELLSSIYSYLSTRSGLPTILYPNIDITTIPDEYLEVYIIPATPDNLGVKSVTWYRGIIQINAVTLNGIGEVRASQIVSLIIEAFKRNTVISGLNIRIDEQPYASGGFSDGNGHYKIPVTIPYNKLCA